jgi:hypothetical protein
MSAALTIPIDEFRRHPDDALARVKAGQAVNLVETDGSIVATMSPPHPPAPPSLTERNTATFERLFSDREDVFRALADR